MARKQPRRFFSSLVQGLWWPSFWGISAAVGIYFALSRGWIASPLLRRYLAGHPIEYVEVTMFCVGISALILRGCELARQFELLGRVQLEPAPEHGASITAAADLSKSISDFPVRIRDGLFAQRLQRGLDFVTRQQSAEKLDDQLKYLAEDEESQAYERLALVRIIVWATPMLGFLGTVIGITMALAQLSPEALVNDPNRAMDGLLGALSVAFDTTALALILSVTIMFTMFLISQTESQLLREVDDQAHSQLANRFQVPGTSRDPHLHLLRQMSEKLVATTERLVDRQAEIWRESFDSASQHWLEAAHGARDQLSQALTHSLQTTLTDHTQRLAQLNDHAEQRVQRWWNELQAALHRNAEQLERHQSELHHQGDVMTRVMQATGEVVKLEHALNRNLKALAGSKNFEDTVMSLSAAIHLLNSRVGLRSHSTTVLDSPQDDGPTQRNALSSKQDQAA